MSNDVKGLKYFVKKKKKVHFQVSSTYIIHHSSFCSYKTAQKKYYLKSNMALFISKTYCYDGISPHLWMK